ncbi:accessory Sec system protein Asp3 [Streptococcus sp. zg-86]|uniref:Accessory Sec system protein Asp3 n=1 Tax=Streptococcus zhangguiae TaxID=2664091 RepID=A0A6I4RK48_9STRE|nr:MULTISPECIES: accessory Sec system protein Asp3 [unclassified Streptococcus]MTB64874.1 accessory Sec system protein Asp3 [Streptococcus sp. zg-86]MTB91056.1 accessory Sec system protein Asp3 [Streptococcus sp. zg-36]MWV56861.1 accessory Sec system protein Asp3 [Streptococcus sp. zg-70]QTH48335.1 accessory Sec system protein Asp3 [Streptococcus sp. zg-86]
MGHRIYWGKIGPETYLTGSILIPKNKTIQIENILIPSGTTMYKWSSSKNYQAAREQANLPLLTRDAVYHLHLSAEVTPSQSVYVRVNFYDRFNKAIDFTILRSSEEQFTYPHEAYYYDIELINAGCTKMIFHYLELEEVTLEKDREKPKALKILFWDQEVKDVLARSLYAKQADTLVLTEGADTLYFDKVNLEKVEQFITQYPRLPIYFIGSGPCGNFAALYHAMYFELGKAYVTNDMYAKEEYDRMISQIFEQEIDVDRFLERLSYKEKVIWYEELRIRDTLSFIVPSMNEIDYALLIPSTD